ncbi:family 4 glycosyl hydrolase [Halorubrum salipaludis]|uniref:family 4 glycosyl hydrolase n=1 Tax=Halorubrum salipaludis TaxID=2032630 RepID=UPI001E2ACB16|nr:hypothetical protein [Halorubrum salipaludis]
MRTGPDGGVSGTPTERRVDELLDRMTVAEKAAQLGSVNADRILTEDGELRPLSAGGFPRPVRSLLSTHVDTIETVIEASRDGDVDRAFQAFLLDPQVRTLQTEAARELFAELVAAEERYLDDWALDDAEALAAADAY